MAAPTAGRRMTPRQIGALLNLSLTARNYMCPNIDRINLDCMAAISLDRDMNNAIPVIRRLVRIASHYPELSTAARKIAEAFSIEYFSPE